jgi:hypothetical protein
MGIMNTNNEITMSGILPCPDGLDALFFYSGTSAAIDIMNDLDFDPPDLDVSEPIKQVGNDLNAIVPDQDPEECIPADYRELRTTSVLKLNDKSGDSGAVQRTGSKGTPRGASTTKKKKKQIQEKEEPKNKVENQLASVAAPLDFPLAQHMEFEVLLREAEDCLPTWPTDGDSRIAILICLAARIVKRAGEWHRKTTMCERVAAMREQYDDVEFFRQIVAAEDLEWLRISPEQARSIFCQGMDRLAIPVSFFGSEPKVRKLWEVANGLPWGPQKADDPMLPWLRRVAEVTLDTRRHVISTAEFKANWDEHFPDEPYSSPERFGRDLKAAIAAAWPEEWKRKQIHFSVNQRYTTLSGSCKKCRAYIGVRFYSCAEPNAENFGVTNFVRRSGGPQWDRHFRD